MRLRPHHVLDIVRDRGLDIPFRPHPYGHANHTVAAALLADPQQEIELVVAADAVCAPCRHLLPDGRCDDILPQLETRTSKQEYNDALDRRLLSFLGFAAGTRLSLRTFLERVAGRLPDVAALCTHPKEDPRQRILGMEEGLRRLGVTPRDS